MFCVYQHSAPGVGVFYVGKGTFRRASSKQGRNSDWKRIVDSAKEFTVTILSRWETEAEAFAHEVFLIACFRQLGSKLCNRSVGGEGSSGWNHTEGWKKAASERMKLRDAVKMTEETKAKISASKVGKEGPWKGRARSEETKAKISLALLGRPGRAHTETSKMKMSAAHTGKTQAPTSPETRTKLSVAAKAAWALRKQLKGQ